MNQLKTIRPKVQNKKTKASTPLFLKGEIRRRQGYGGTGGKRITKPTFGFFSREKKFPSLPAYSFTLIELLVVIAIIAVLAAILMPALQQARERGKAVSCQSNMKQLGMVFGYYGDDSGGYMPCLDNLGGAGAVDSRGEAIDAKSWLNDTVRRYLGKIDASKEPVAVLRCPDEEAKVDITTNYGLNYLVATRGVGMGIKREEHKQPSRTAMIVENTGHLCYYCGVTNPAGVHQTGSSYGKNRAAKFRHQERAGVVFIDTHVESRRGNELPCLESFPLEEVSALENTVFNQGKVDTNLPTVGGF